MFWRQGHGRGTVWLGVKSIWAGARPGWSDDINSAGQMRKLLERERARTDRAGGQFSVVLFELSGWGISNHLRVRPLVNQLAQRLRKTDDFGWFGGSIAVLLPNTTPDNARRVAEQIVHDLKGNGASWMYTLYSYPLNEENLFCGTAAGEGDESETPAMAESQRARARR